MKPVHVNPHHVKKSKELDDNNPNKNDRKESKTIAALVNEGRFSYPTYQPVFMRRSGAYRIFVSGTQEELTRIRIKSLDGLPFIFLNIKRRLWGFNGSQRTNDTQGSSIARRISEYLE